jgi:hypothetical protein
MCFMINRFRQRLIKYSCADGITKDDLEFVRIAVNGFMTPKIKVKKSMLSGDKLKASLRRSGFLSFLWGLWCESIPGINVEQPRIIPNVITTIGNEQLYRHIVNYFGECVNFVVFCCASTITYSGSSRKKVQLPTETGEKVLHYVIYYHAITSQIQISQIFCML